MPPGGMTDTQFKDEQRKELEKYEEYLELLEEGNLEKLKKKFLKTVERIQKSLED